MRVLARFALALALTVVLARPVHADNDVRYKVTGYTCDPAHGQYFCGATIDGTPVAVGVASCPRFMHFGDQAIVHFNDGDYVLTCHDYAASPYVFDLWQTTLNACYTHTGFYYVTLL